MDMPTIIQPNPRFSDVLGRLKVASQQNIYDADFEYGPQPLRWEALNFGGGTVLHQPTRGGVRLSITTASGDIAIRQSRPYHRYQPGKTMFMATAAWFGTGPQTNTRQRIGFFDDSNGAFFEEGDPTPANPSGLGVVLRSDLGGVVTDTRIELPDWTGNGFDASAREAIVQIDWTRIQMLFIEYAWYGAGAVRWGVFLNGQPFILHQIGAGNRAGQQAPWARTGNLPVRYELRNLAAVAASTFVEHYGVSVIVEGRVDEQRGFTYSYGRQGAALTASVGASATRIPILSVRGRPMGQQAETNSATSGTTTTLTRTGAGWTINQWVGYSCFIASGTGAGQLARITANNATTLTFQDPITGGALAVAPAAASGYVIGYPNRGQLLPRRLNITSSAPVRLELISNATLTGFVWDSLSALGSPNSFAQRDITATSLAGGEVVYGLTIGAAAGAVLTELPLDQLFPLVNNIRGTSPDILTLAITTGAAAANVSAELNCQEAMS